LIFQHFSGDLFCAKMLDLFDILIICVKKIEHFDNQTILDVKTD